MKPCHQGLKPLDLTRLEHERSKSKLIPIIFHSTSSTVSSGINSLATLILEDLVRPCFPRLAERAAMRVGKLLGNERERRPDGQ